MGSKVTDGNKSLIGDLGNNPAVQSALAAIISQLLTAFPGLILGLFRKKPTEPVTVPTPVPVQPDEEFPDDTIPEPKAERTIKSVRLKLTRAQYNKQRFPDQYANGKDGLYSSAELRAIEDGTSALNYASKFWLDLTAFDEEKKEFLRPAVLAAGLAYDTEHHCGDAYIKGFGPNEKNDDGTPKAEVESTNEIGNGITAWNSSLGFLHQMKAHKEGEFECWGSVGGVESNHFIIKVS